MTQMNLKEAVTAILELPHPKYEDRSNSKYMLAKLMGVQPITIDNWLRTGHGDLTPEMVKLFNTNFDIAPTGYQTVWSY